MIIAMFRAPPKMAVMKFVWPLCALFGSLLVVWFYYRFTRGGGHSEQPFAVSVAKGALHCGAGCALADMIAETLAHYQPGILSFFGLGWLFGEEIYATWTFDFIMAFSIGIAFQYFAIAPMRDLSVKAGITAAIKADALSLTSWQIGMYGVMAVAHFWLFKTVLGAQVDVAMPLFWFAMQLAMIAGFVTAYFPNWLLIASGVKERM
ncbi:DUF4396 domain-containing protein [Altericroceibacterium indicum]|nr:DUF4396 domain-containing protein [Altericroceibacterium indicum]